MLTILHFSDAHIDMAAHGRRDPSNGLPIRVEDFLKALDTIIDTAIEERVDMVLFSGDAYKDRTPVPTFQREWGKRIIRLSEAGIQTILLVGNHDLSPAVGRANALQEFDTLQVPHIRVVSKPSFLRPADLGGVAVQILALPWVSRSSLMATLEANGADPNEIYEEMEARLGALVNLWMAELDPTLPTILMAHASVQGAVYGGERSVMLGSDLVLPGSLVRNSRLDYVALGHIHKAQNLNPDSHPPVIYPGSIERVDFGEAADEKYFVVAHVEQGKTEVEWRRLNGRRFIDCFVHIQSAESFFEQAVQALPAVDELEGAIVRLVLEYPREWEDMLDEAALRRHAQNAFEFHLVRRPQMEARLRLPGDQAISSLTPLDLLDIYWKTSKTNHQDLEKLQELALTIITEDDSALHES